MRFSSEYRPVEDGRLKTDGYYCLDRSSANHNILLYPDGTFMWYDETEWQLYRQQLKEYLDRKAADAALKSDTPNR